MWILIAVLILAVLLLAAWLFILAPNPDGQQRMAPFEKWDYAHRGLYKKDQTIPENTLAAYEAAAEQGYGIELDVRLTRDGEMVLHHDDSLKRLCGDDRLISQCDLAELADIRVGSSEQKLPTFAEALRLVSGRVPLIVELKTVQGNADELCPRVAGLLDQYGGPYTIESFDPQAVRWFKKNRPDVVRGLLVSPRWSFHGKSLPGLLATRLLLDNAAVRPDFIAYDVAGRRNPALRLTKQMFGTREVSWTVRTQEQYDALRKEGVTPIFEGFIPKKF
ncbi:MAG: glycerophosphodiester phosphodiesterase family protein [Oscillospiraceae bacterium]|nr:glycerophosphodiester phosphodiesterase family protein [Oscillospiraceae bacterium]